MSTIAEEVSFLLGAEREEAGAERAARRVSEEVRELEERYVRATPGGRLNLWLQFRDSRKSMDELEAEWPGRGENRLGRWYGLFGLPRL